MERSPIKDVEIKVLLKNTLTSKIKDRTIYIKGIDNSYYYEGYNPYKTKKFISVIYSCFYVVIINLKENNWLV